MGLSTTQLTHASFLFAIHPQSGTGSVFRKSKMLFSLFSTFSRLYSDPFMHNFEAIFYSKRRLSKKRVSEVGWFEIMTKFRSLLSLILQGFVKLLRGMRTS